MKKPTPTAAAMAEVMTDREAGAGCCTQDDLLAAGFSAEDIARHAEAARALAAAGSRRATAA